MAKRDSYSWDSSTQEAEAGELEHDGYAVIKILS